jgi:hypothetical protein
MEYEEAVSFLLDIPEGHLVRPWIPENQTYVPAFPPFYTTGKKTQLGWKARKMIYVELDSPETGLYFNHGMTKWVSLGVITKEQWEAEKVIYALSKGKHRDER